MLTLLVKLVVLFLNLGLMLGFSFVGWTGEGYRWVNDSPMKQAFLEGYTRVS